MDYEYVNPYNDPILSDYEAKCNQPDCGWETKLRMHDGAGVRVGDVVYKDPENEAFGRCMKCKRYSLVVTKSPVAIAIPGPKGFWRVPTE